MAASYKLFSRNGFMKSIEKSGAKALAETALEYFETKDALLDVNRFFKK
jgi:hypothetical protein